MKNSFDPHSFLQKTGKDIVAAFDKADDVTTPSGVGDAKEKSVIERFDQILPVGIGVGSGYVFDSYGKTSQQMDVVLFEKDICPRFSYSESATYYPCESVIAIGEIKNSIGKAELSDIFSKTKSVKSLKRFSQPEYSPLQQRDCFSYRMYGSKTGFQGTPEEDYCQDSKPIDQIFTFALAKSFQTQRKTYCDHFLSHLRNLKAEKNLHLAPNLIVTLDNEMLSPILLDKRNCVISFQEATGIGCFNMSSSNFRFLIERIHFFCNKGRTVPVSAINRYFAPNDEEQVIDGLLLSF